ncbi:uncharacterized protein LOC115629847 [Scaptodrosophila lebanonensis]|uniref:Uncharacterized protein LOC115629847 n=1 Tax=Drosophila lebanonensis TaxID=7225 RepID=A0A6J2U563_DROLE|nr:uncharacterized protein LOC115629847 [Scaptodrosophila lebanonensis]
MHIDDGLKQWLDNPNKPFDSKLNFAIKVWQSFDFACPNKYEVIITWLTEALRNSVSVNLPVLQLQQLFRLRSQPGAVSTASKTALILVLLRVTTAQPSTRAAGPELLRDMLNFELLQDTLRSDYKLLMQSYSTLFQSYERYLVSHVPASADSLESEFALPLLQQLSDYVQRAQNLEPLRKCYDKIALRPLVELYLQLRIRGVCCFEQIAALEKQLTSKIRSPNSTLIDRLKIQVPYSRFLALECLLYNHRFEPKYVQLVLERVFDQHLGESRQAPELVLSEAAYTLEALRKHEISLQFVMQPLPTTMTPQPLSATEKKETALAYVERQIYQYVRMHKHNHLLGVLRLLCSALRLNPLLLEQHVYQIAVWMLTTPKYTADEHILYAEFLVHLLDMFRRLSRAERFVMNLIKTLREWLAKFELKCPYRRDDEDNSGRSPSKRRCLDDEKDPNENIYMKLLFGSFKSSPPASVLPDPFEHLSQRWPTSTVGVAFTHLITQLMAKPSIVIWKTLLHALSELLDENCAVVLPSNLDFSMELHAALLCQYFQGTRVAEQLESHQAAVEEQLFHTGKVLQKFGRHLLRQEHNRRTMNAFLECLEQASSFEHMLLYYWPDGLARVYNGPNQLHDFLAQSEWTLIRQRVHNFGRKGCRRRLKHLDQQLANARWLFDKHRPALCADAMPIESLSSLTREQKNLLIQNQEDQYRVSEYTVWHADADCVELLALKSLEHFATTLREAKVTEALIPKLPFGTLRHVQNEGALVQLATTIRQHDRAIIKRFPKQPTADIVHSLKELPIAQLSRNVKSKLWLLVFSLYRDLRYAQEEDDHINALLELLIDMMHFGQPLAICLFFPKINELLELVPATPLPMSGWRFYHTLFVRSIRRHGPGTDIFLTSCADYLCQCLKAAHKLKRQECSLLLLAIETLTAMSGAQARRQLQPFLETYGLFLAHKFRSISKDPSYYKEFVQATLGGYAIYVSTVINRAEKQEANAVPIDESFRRVCKIYIGHSLNYRNPHAIRLLNVALTHRQQLHLDQDEIEFVLNTYWQQLCADIESGEMPIKSIEPAIKLIIGYKTNEDFLLLLRGLAIQIDELPQPVPPEQHTCLRNVLTLLSLFAKCALSSIKGAILNEYFELISGNVVLRLPPGSSPTHCSQLVCLLEAQRALAGNRTIPLSGDTLDCMLTTVLNVDIKRHISAGGCWEHFVELHTAITDNCTTLLRQRSPIMADRVPQLTMIYQDLLQSIVCYKSGRTQAISESEVDCLAELGLKLATFIASVVSMQALAVKRVAPFLLIFTIKQMVGSEQPTTVFEKIKMQVVHICHQLISLCDHRSGHFVLRASSEAGRRMYQSLIKEHEKYHRFKGKV